MIHDKPSMTANPYSIEPNHRAPRSKATVLNGRDTVAIAWIEHGKTLVRLDKPGLIETRHMRHIANAVDGWANAQPR